MAPDDTHHCTHRGTTPFTAHPTGRLESDGLEHEIQSNYRLEADRCPVKSYEHVIRPGPVKNKTVKNDETSSPSLSRKQKKRNKKKKSSPKADDSEVPSPTNSLESYEEGKEKSMQLVKCMGFSDQEVDMAMSRLGKQPITMENLLDEVYRAQDEIISLSALQPPKLSPKCQRSSKLQTDSAALSSEESDYEDEASSSTSNQEEETRRSYLRAVEREKLKYRNMIEELTPMCRVCNCSRATILLLPCGHLVCCDDCLMDVRRCPVNRCNKIVRGTKEVYFA